MSASELSLAASRVYVSLQRLLPTRHGMEVDSARFFSRTAVRTFNVCSLCGFLLPSSRALSVHGCHVNWSHVRVRRTISSCDLGGRLRKRELVCVHDGEVVYQLEVHSFPRLRRLINDFRMLTHLQEPKFVHPFAGFLVVLGVSNCPPTIVSIQF